MRALGFLSSCFEQERKTTCVFSLVVVGPTPAAAPPDSPGEERVLGSL